MSKSDSTLGIGKQGRLHVQSDVQSFSPDPSFAANTQENGHNYVKVLSKF